MINIDATLNGLAYLAVALFWIVIAKFVQNKLDHTSEHEIHEQSNFAVALHRAGLYLALPLGLMGAIVGPSQGLARDIQILFLDGAVLTVLLLAAGAFSDRMLIPNLDNRKAIREGNVAVALVDFGVFIATGLIAKGAFAGEGGGIASAVIFFLLGQLALLLFALAYEKFTSFHSVEQIRDGNVAAALMVASMVLALGIVLSTSIAGPFTGWGVDLTSFALSAAGGMAALLLLLWPVEKLFLNGTSLQVEIERDRNIASVAVAASVQIALAIMVSAIFI